MGYLSTRRLRSGLKREFRALRHALRSYYLVRLLKREPRLVRQKPCSLSLDFGDASNLSELRNHLEQRGVRFSEGKHTLYVPPQPGLRQKIGLRDGLYPPDAGFKLLKRFAPIERSRYLIDGYRQPVERAMMGSLENQADAANLLYGLGLAPRLYDLVEIHSNRFSAGCFVVEHVQGEAPSHNEWLAFMEQMKAQVEGLDGALALVRAEGWAHCDFDSPDCGGNLIKRDSDGNPKYIDFQQFVIADKAMILKHWLEDEMGAFSFGGTHRLLGNRPCVYQSVPGMAVLAKRDVEKRWKLLRSLLCDAGIDVRERVILDVCCNAGMFMSLALRDGARMGMGWDLPEVVGPAERLQLLAGNTRVRFFPARLHSDYCIADDVPAWLERSLRGSIVLYLAAWRHVGLIHDLANIEWQALLYEGHQEDSQDETLENLRQAQALWQCELVVHTVLKDGDSDARPIALFVRR